MFRVVYVSSATAPFSDQQLGELLQISRRNNLAANVTGMLLYKDGNFMQTLEGPKMAVQTLLKKIGNDPRHHHLTVLMDGPIEERSFETWTMGFKKITAETVIDFPGYIKSDDLSLMSDQFLHNPPRSVDLLIHLKHQI